MNKKFITLSLIGSILTFIGGFLLANALNRNEINTLTSENNRLAKNQTEQTNNQNELNLSDEEIRDKIVEAEKNPENFSYQKGLGLGLYRYAMLKQDKELLSEVAKLLQRAYDLNSDDYEVIVSLGNIYYDLGQINKDSKSNQKAKSLYEKALSKNPKDNNVRTDLGLTYLLTDSPQLEKAVEELEKALESDPKNEKALRYITQAYIKKENVQKASEYLSKLKEINSQNQGIAELEQKMEQVNK